MSHTKSFTGPNPMQLPFDFLIWSDNNDCKAQIEFLSHTKVNTQQHLLFFHCSFKTYSEQKKF